MKVQFHIFKNLPAFDLPPRTFGHKYMIKMKEIQIKKYVRLLFFMAILIFILNKLFIRPWILENDVSELLLIISFSLPNLTEAIVGTLILTGILLQMRQYFNEKFGTIKESHIYLAAVGIASIYVISQELKFHNLGGNNVFDYYDIIASIIGLIGTYTMIHLFGFADELEMDTRNKNKLQNSKNEI